MDEFRAQFLGLIEQATGMWIAGGWCMPPIALVALLMFGIAIHELLRLRGKGFTRLPEATWRDWIDRPNGRRGTVGRILDYVGRANSLDAMAAGFTEVRAVELAPFRRDLRVMKVCVAAAPLLGLLGTVTGMLATFEALAGGSGGEQTMAQISKGIAEALITTETGLMVALPGLFLQFNMTRRLEHYEAFLAHVESVSMQEYWRRMPEPAVAV